MITRDMILKGEKYHEEFDSEEYGASFLIRPLNDGEASKIQEITMKSIPMEFVMQIQDSADKNKLDVLKDIKDPDVISNFVKATNDSNYQVCSYGIVDEKGNSLFSVDEVKQFKIGVPAKIAKRIREISGMDNTEELTDKVADFRPEP